MMRTTLPADGAGYARWLVVVLLFGAASGAVVAEGLDPQSEIRPFVRELAARDGLDAVALERILSRARILPAVLDRIARPAEAMPWHAYRKLFLTPERVAGGVRFWANNQALLERARREYGVDPAVIVAILGVETFYGRHQGRTRVLDALATLGFRYPRRGSFFRAELEQFLLLSHEERLDPLALEGSYAGAMGFGQFIPSSYRRYAVDFDGDRQRDLIGNVADATGSIANYLRAHGWQSGAPIAIPVTVSGARYRTLLERGLAPHTPIAGMPGFGVHGDALATSTRQGALIELAGAAGPEYWIGLRNFYVITRYNHSPLYAMAVWQLARAISQAREDRR